MHFQAVSKLRNIYENDNVVELTFCFNNKFRSTWISY